MRITQTITPEEPFPHAHRVLLAWREREFHSPKHNLRHPLGIYNMSVAKVMTRLRAVVDELNRVQGESLYQDPSQVGLGDRLMAEQDHLLDALMEHFDDCNNVLRCFSASPDEPLAKTAYAVFKRETATYRKLVAPIVSALKHEQRSLQPIYFHDHAQFDPGYFVEGPADDGSIGPDPTIHSNGNTAFSFARDLRVHVCGLYFMGAALRTAMSSFGKLPSAKASEPAKSDDPILACLRQISLLPLRFFPDETKKPIPSVRGKGSYDMPGYVIQYPSSDRVGNVRGRLRVHWGADGVSMKYRIPYAAPTAQ